MEVLGNLVSTISVDYPSLATTESCLLLPANPPTPFDSSNKLKLPENLAGALHRKSALHLCPTSFPGCLGTYPTGVTAMNVPILGAIAPIFPVDAINA